LPGFLVPRRKYEVNKSHWLVKFGSPMIRLLFVAAGTVILLIVRGGEKGAFLLIHGGRRGLSSLAILGRKVVLFVEWRRMPKEWEVSFVNKMKSMEARGIQFPEVLKEYLPSIIGEGPSEVLLRWVGRQTRLQPKRFTNAVREMFGKSSKSIITGLERLSDPEKMIEDSRPVEPPYQSLVDAIKAADGE
jgi:hypothetical protein